MYEILIFIVAFCITISVHEAAHAWVANYLGDPTARHAGRMSLNPLRHLDPLGTIALFLVHFGWGKPVPVNPYNLRNPRRDQALISFSGPLSNFITALVFALLLKRLFRPLTGDASILSVVTEVIIQLNLVLMIFNLIPIPPLDGSKVLFAFLPERLVHMIPDWERKGPLILFAIIIISSLANINVFGYILGYPVDLLWGILMKTT
jgi:Zn-dependent protease